MNDEIEITRLRSEVSRLTQERDEALNELDEIYGVLGTADAEGGNPAAHDIDIIITDRDAAISQRDVANAGNDRLRKELDVAYHQCRHWERLCNEWSTKVFAAESRLAALQAENERLKEALASSHKPIEEFAQEERDAGRADRAWALFDASNRVFDRARAAMEAEPE